MVELLLSAGVGVNFQQEKNVCDIYDDKMNNIVSFCFFFVLTAPCFGFVFFQIG